MCDQNLKNDVKKITEYQKVTNELLEKLLKVLE